MRISQRSLLDKDANAPFAIASVALSLLVLAYSIRFGPAAILLFYAIWLPLFFVRSKILLENASRVWPILVLPAIATASTLWSDVPAVSLRAGIQYGTTVFCGLVAARVVSLPNLAAGGMLGGLGVLIYSALNGSYAYDVVDGTYAFNGAFGSKNQLGYFCSVAFIFAVAVLLLYRSRALWRVVAFTTAVIALVMLQMSDSATSVLSLGFSICILSVALALSKLPARLRDAAIAGILFAGFAIAAGAVYLGAFDATLAAFGKDTTLTGRTYLWQEGINAGSENPLFGMGYNAFWVPGRPQAEVLWEEFYITAKSGFHFHNMLLESFVALGALGVALTGAWTLGLIITAVLTVRRSSAIASSALCSSLALLFVLRSAVEIDFFTPYTLGSFLVPFLLLNMVDRYAADRHRLVHPTPDHASCRDAGPGGYRAVGVP